MIRDYLQKLNDVIDPDVLAQAEARTRAALLYEPVDRLPMIVGCPLPGWIGFSYREGFHDMEKMLLNELGGAWVGAHAGDDRMYTIRPNYGVGIIPSMFGCEIVLTDDNTMPWCHALSDRQLDGILETGKIDIEAGLGSRVIETIKFYQDALADYDKLSRCVHIFVCDTQGPFDIAHLVMGSKIYTEIYDNPERVHRLLDITTDAYIRFTRLQKNLIGEGCEWSYHSQMMSRGGIRVCEDTATNLSTDSYREFPARYNSRVLAEFGGGWIHYCGGGKQILDAVLATPELTGINFGNPEMQDIGMVCAKASPKKIPVLGWLRPDDLPQEVVTGVTLMTGANDVESARALLSRR